MDRAIRSSRAHGIRFILGTPSYSPPAWLFAQYPDVRRHGIRMASATSLARQISESKSSPHYIAAVKRIVTVMGEHYANDPNALAFFH